MKIHMLAHVLMHTYTHTHATRTHADTHARTCSYMLHKANLQFGGMRASELTGTEFQPAQLNRLPVCHQTE